jgi:hypothetical protein
MLRTSELRTKNTRLIDGCFYFSLISIAYVIEHALVLTPGYLGGKPLPVQLLGTASHDCRLATSLSRLLATDTHLLQLLG